MVEQIDDHLRDMGRHFGAGLYEREVRYLHDPEFARTAEDIIWRRTKLGLKLRPKEVKDLAAWVGRHLPKRASPG